MLIKLENIQKYYKVGKDELHVLKSLNLEIESGEFVMIMGKSGSGKTTLLNILGFLDVFDEGRYIFDGTDVTNLSENERSVFRNINIGFVFQQFNLIETLNVYQNVELPLIYNKALKKSNREEIVKDKLSSVGLWSSLSRNHFNYLDVNNSV